jgi:hypothetical protein
MKVKAMSPPNRSGNQAGADNIKKLAMMPTVNNVLLGLERAHLW